MPKSRVVAYLLCLVLVFGVLGGLVGDGVALAAKESSNGSLVSPPNQEQPIETSLTLSSQFPMLRAKSGNTFEFKVELSYQGEEDTRVFDLTASAPQNWVTAITPEFETTEISAIRLKAFQGYPDKVKVQAAPFPGRFLTRVIM